MASSTDAFDAYADVGVSIRVTFLRSEGDVRPFGSYEGVPSG
jgi:hypothetical protein